MHILLLSAYDAHSHRRWRKGLLTAFPEHDWTVLALPPRHFLWRVRGNSLSWAFGERELLLQPYDLVIATSMTDLSALRGMVAGLATVPTLVYFHENQFVYPDRRAQPRDEPRVVNLYTALAADRVLFNSEFNRQTFLDGAREFLANMPDRVPPGIPALVREKSAILPVPLDACWFAEDPAAALDKSPLTIVWNHRWEYDKGPERLFAALIKLQQAGVDFRVHVIGQQFRDRPPVFAGMRAQLGDSIGVWGRVEADADYRRLLRESHVALSTSLHEFQGLAVQDAVACGCVPLVPDRLAYPEYFERDYRYRSYPQDPEAEAVAIAERLSVLAEQQRAGGLPPPPDLRGLSWTSQRPAYAAELDTLFSRSGRTHPVRHPCR
jgi:glycosyltransferase involved in cell wall biosynthesis